MADLEDETPRPGDGWDDTWKGKALGLFFVGIWLVFLSDAVVTAWDQRATARGDVGLAALVGFSVVYLAHFTNLRHTAWRLQRTVPANRWFVSRMALAGWLGLAVLAAVATVTLGQQGASSWVFFAVSGLWTFRLRLAFAIGGALVLLYELLAYHVSGWDHDSSVSMSMVMAMAAVSGAMLASSRQRALAEARDENARLMVEEERNRMARDVHDILGHSLTVITVKAELAARLLEVDPQRARAEVADLERLSRDALADVRRAVAGFREISLSGELARARKALSTAGIAAELPTATDDVPSDMRELCAWAVREGVTNVIRHSSASRCTITLDDRGVTIVDDGAPAAESSGQGNGLVGLHERAAAVGAEVVARRREPRGFELSVLAPPGPTAEHSRRLRPEGLGRPVTP